MSFQPVIPAGGLVGWRFLQRTMETQTSAFEKSAALTRDTEYFQARIGDVSSAEDLVSDRRLLRIALGAFGLQDDIDNRFFIRKVLEDGTLDPDALSNRLADDRYKRMSKAFGFGDFPTPNTRISDFAARIVGMYRTQQFEVAVGQQDDNIRLALNARRSLPELVAETGSETTKWFRIMGNAPLRQVFEMALGLPSGFGQLDLDKQLEVFQDKARQQLDIESVSDLTDPATQDKLVQRFLLRAEISQSQSFGAGSVALMLLQSAPRLFP